MLGRGYIPRLVIDTAYKIISQLSGPILDVGCGNGELLYRLKNNFEIKGIGLDISEAELSLARKKSIPVVRGDAFYLPFKDASFNVVLCFNTLYNFPDLTVLLPIFYEMVRVTAPGGRIILDLRNRKNPVITIKYWWHMRKKEFPTIAHNPSELQNILNKLGCILENKVDVGSKIPIFTWGYIFIFKKDKKC